MSLRLSLRALARSPLFTGVATISLAIAIGANTVTFSVLNGLLLKPLPVRAPDQLYRIGLTREGSGFLALSHPEYLELEDAIPSLDGVVGHQVSNVILGVGELAVMAQMEVVTGNYFDVLGVTPALGRGFQAEEDLVPGRDAVAVISHEVWRTRLNGEPGVLGSTLQLNGRPFTVIGVAPREFSGTFTGFQVDVWVPVMMMEQVQPRSGSLASRGDRFLMLIGRLREGSTPDEARSQLAALAARWSREYPELNENVGLALSAAGGVHPFIAQAVRAFLGLMMGMVAVVLLIACANIANLMLARVSTRLRETAVRAALGAGRRRIAGLFLQEGMLIAGLGGAGGLLLAIWATQLVSALRPDVGIAVSLDVGVDVRVVVFAFVVTALTALLFTAGPALRAAETRVIDRLREAGTTGAGRTRGRSLLVVLQVAMSALLLFGASLLVRSLQRTRFLETGFDPANVLVVTASPELLGLDETRGRAFWLEYAARVQRIPGVSAAALALFVPMGDRGDAIQAQPFGSTASSGPDSRVPYNFITPGYFDLLRIRLNRGRDFQDSDGASGPPVAIVSQAMASRFWPDQNAIGKQLRIIEVDGRERVADVVGVADDIALSSPGEAPRPLLYLPFSQWYRPDMMLHVRSNGAPGLAALLETELQNTLPGLPARIRTMTQATSFTLIPLRVASSVLGVAGFIGLILAATGIFGLIAYLVSRQDREIAIRMALGAERQRVRQMVLARAIRLTAIGLVAGIGAAIFAAQLIRSMLFGVAPTDPIALVGVVVVFTAVSLLAAWLPARRASSVDPAVVLRE